MKKIDLERIKKIGLKEEDFEPKDDSVTVADLLEAVNLLAEMIFGGDEE